MEDEIQVPENKIDSIVKSVNDKTSKLRRELLAYHYKLKHLPFSSLKKLAMKGIIPKRLKDVPAPLCYSFMMGKQQNM
jgi:hypothetical protein